jgi:hypothetical protein
MARAITDDLSNREREIYWKAGHLVRHQASIGPKSEQTEILLPFLARLLYDNNSSDHLVRRGLQFQLDALTQDNLPDNAIPTLLERIDYLNSLIGREAIQVKELRERLPVEPPMP